MTRADVLHLANAVRDLRGHRPLRPDQYRQASAICRARGLVTEEELRGARHDRKRVARA